MVMDKQGSISYNVSRETYKEFACAVFFKKTNRKGWMLWVPMAIMLCVTLTALVQKIFALIAAPTAGNLLQLAFAVALTVLGVIVAGLGVKRLSEK